jgi:hypothetical protein
MILITLLLLLWHPEMSQWQRTPTRQLVMGAVHSPINLASWPYPTGFV